MPKKIDTGPLTVTIADQVRGIIASTLVIEPHKVTDEAELRDDLGCDSLDPIELSVELEDAFDIALSDDEVERWNTVGDVVRSVEAQR